jgi:hypothetical protein
LSQINIIWFMLSSFVVIFLFWYIPEILKYTGGIAMTWLTRYWWIPAIVLGIVVPMVFFWIYLQYKLKLRAMGMEMELAKFKFLQLEGNARLLIESESGSATTRLQETQAEENQPEKAKDPDVLNSSVAFEASTSLGSIRQ